MELGLTGGDTLTRNTGLVFFKIIFELKSLASKFKDLVQDVY